MDTDKHRQTMALGWQNSTMIFFAAELITIFVDFVDEKFTDQFYYSKKIEVEFERNIIISVMAFWHFFYVCIIFQLLLQYSG